MRSISTQLTRSLLVALAVSFIGGGLLAYSFARSFLYAQFDSALRTKADALTIPVEHEQGELIFELAGDERDAALSDETVYFEIWANGDDVLVRSPSLHGHDLVRFANAEDGAIAEMTLPDGKRGRAVFVRFLAREEEGTVADWPASATPPTCELMFAKTTSSLEHALATFAASLVCMEGFVVVAILFIVRWRVRAGLRPLDLFAAQVADIDETSLDQSITLAEQPRELAVVRERLNQLLARLRAAFERERRFTYAAAHELRTPIAELRTLAEVSLKWPTIEPSSEASHAAPFAEVREIACEMENVIGALLVIARNGRGLAELPRESLSLRGVLDGTVAKLELAARARNLEIRIDAAPDLTVCANAQSLALILRNLVENAVQYAPERTAVEIDAALDSNGVRVRVGNDVRGFREAELSRLFEPFWRAEHFRNGAEHQGLGLAVVRALSEGLGCTIDARIDRPDHIVFELWIPNGTLVARSSPSSVLVSTD